MFFWSSLVKSLCVGYILGLGRPAGVFVFFWISLVKSLCVGYILGFCGWVVRRVICRISLVKSLCVGYILGLGRPAGDLSDFLSQKYLCWVHFGVGSSAADSTRGWLCARRVAARLRQAGWFSQLLPARVAGQGGVRLALQGLGAPCRASSRT